MTWRTGFALFFSGLALGGLVQGNRGWPLIAAAIGAVLAFWDNYP